MRPEVGDQLKDEIDEPAAPLPPNGQTCIPLCDNCFHDSVCGVAVQIRLMARDGMSVSVGECSHYMPVEEGDTATKLL